MERGSPNGTNRVLAVSFMLWYVLYMGSIISTTYYGTSLGMLPKFAASKN